MDLIDLLAADSRVRSFASALASGRRAAARGSIGSSTHLVAGAVARLAGRGVLLVVAHPDDAEEACDEIRALARMPALVFPALEQLPGESSLSLDLLAQRLDAVHACVRALEPGPRVVVAPMQALMQPVHDEAGAAAILLRLERGREFMPGGLIAWLERAGYSRIEAVEEPGDYAVRGGIIDVFTPWMPGGSGGGAVRLDFLGTRLETIHEISLDTMGSDSALPGVDLLAVDPDKAVPEPPSRSFVSLLPRETIAILHETGEIAEQARGYHERVTEGRGIVPPKEVLALVRARFAGLGEVNQFTLEVPETSVRVDLPVAPVPVFASEIKEALAELEAQAREWRVEMLCQTPGELARFRELLGAREHEEGGRRACPIDAREAYLHRGFAWEGDAAPAAGARVLVLPYHELVHRYHARRRGSGRRGGEAEAGGPRLRDASALDTFMEFEPGDYVVHAEHGIARFVGLASITPRRSRAGAAAVEPEEFLTLEFSGASKLHVPMVQIDQVRKYIGGGGGGRPGGPRSGGGKAGAGGGGRPPLSALGGSKWKNQKERVSESVRDLAGEMLRVRAAREHMPGIRYPDDTTWQREFEGEFPFEETEDQLAALGEIKGDMQRARPMDRLVCGDVGFGKTELAIRAAFKAVETGRQAAVLVPTTVLAEQHERTFRSRFAGYPFRIESLSRFKTGSETNAILGALRQGRVDVVIGTHRLLSKDVRFADLGLVIIDEEQRFGVEHKERLLQLRLTVDVLTLSATPIPRTLHMAMLGLRDISSLTTAPHDRRAVVTEVIPWNDRRIERAIARELAREGQVFFVHNRVASIKGAASRVQTLAPDARIVVGHGQMGARELEDVMLRFMRRQADILVSTTIIESGIDIPTANTIIIADADRFGLADLHQLRGRVGRFKHRAYCYLILPESRSVTGVAMRRLKAIEQYSMLGAGFKIAMRDLEIRGAGNLLGAEQSGHIAAVGYDMYCRLLEDAVHELTHGRAKEVVSATSIEIGVWGAFAKAYIPSDSRRMAAYRRLASASTLEGVRALGRDLESAYGEPPPAAQRLLELGELRVSASGLGVRSIAIDGPDVVFRAADPVPVAERMASAAGTVTTLPPKRHDSPSEVYYRPPRTYLESGDRGEGRRSLLRVLRARLGDAPRSAGDGVGVATGTSGGRGGR